LLLHLLHLLVLLLLLLLLLVGGSTSCCTHLAMQHLRKRSRLVCCNCGCRLAGSWCGGAGICRRSGRRT